jgi:hypothetical protein
LLDEHAEITDHFGDAGKVSTELWLSLYASTDAVLAEATRRKMVSLRASISGPAPSPLETLMIDLVIVSRLRAFAMQALQAQALLENRSDAIVREQTRQIEKSLELFGQSLKQLAELHVLIRDHEGDQHPLRLTGVGTAHDNEFNS